MHSQCEPATGYDEDQPHERRGVKTRLIGVAIIILGVLDSLLTLRGGMPSEPYLILIAIGVAIFSIGAVRSRRDILREKNHEA